jgi:glycogen debranching enzyme GlgX
MDRRMTPAAPSLQSGKPWPLGTHWDGQGVNFAVFSAEAERIELCLFDEAGTQLSCTALPGRSHDVWHGYLPGAKPGLVYGLRAHGAWNIQQGQRFNPAKLLLDPYAREIVGEFDWSDLHFGGDRHRPEQIDRNDNAATALKARVVHDRFDWSDDQPPRWAMADTVLYELHVKGFTQQHPGVPAELRGTYAGLASDAAIEHLQRLGISAVSLLPVHQAIDEERLVRMGLRNYWGYNTVGFFCPDPRLAAAHDGSGVRDEFRRMVKRLHQAGIEVILDVVFNHSCETDERGPTIHFRGLDNRSYYRLPYAYPELYENDTGTGNTLDLRHPRVLQMVMDSLRYWVADMHVDGFRFDLATVLGRGSHGFDRNAPFFHAVAQCPVLSRVKMIAEPWDIGPGGYQVGGFPAGWMEWNDRYRDTMRSFWLRGTTHCGEFARRLCASSDAFQARGRTPAESVNFIAAHDGFTLADLVSYNEKHNQANGEDNRDGHGENHSWNCGAEGPSNDASIVALRARLQRALIATLLLSQGTPMLCAGDELGHTQDGNNNAYCQDNETSWIDWSRADASLQRFTAHVLTLRRSLLPLANRWYSGQVGADGRADLAWLRPDGRPMHGDDWHTPTRRVLGALVGVQGKAKAALLLLINAAATEVPFALPPGNAWSARLDSAQPDGQVAWSSASGTPYPLAARSVVLLVAEPGR